MKYIWYSPQKSKYPLYIVLYAAYKGLVRPILEYGSSVWDLQSILLRDELEKVQKRAARFVTGNYVDYETGSMTGILKQLKWESLKKRRKDSRLIMLYKGLKGAASLPTNDLVAPIRRTRYHHSLESKFQWLVLIYTSPVSSPRL